VDVRKATQHLIMSEDSQAGDKGKCLKLLLIPSGQSTTSWQGQRRLDAVLIAIATIIKYDFLDVEKRR